MRLLAYQDRRTLMLLAFFTLAFLGCFAVTALTLLVPEVTGPISYVGDLDTFIDWSIRGIVASIGAIFVMTKL